MAETPLTDSIEALTTYANQTTGASDTNLSDAVYTLAQGYGGSGGYSDDPTDFTGGNIQALISHSQEYVITDYYPQSNVEVFVKAAKDIAYRNFESLFGTFFPNSLRIGTQMASHSLTDFQVYSNSTGTLRVDNVMSTTPNVFRFGLLLSTGIETAISKMAILNSYYQTATRLDIPGGFIYCGMKCYEAGVLKHHFAPWLDGTGVPCVKDLKTGDVYYNAGTGNFDYIDLNGNTITT